MKSLSSIAILLVLITLFSSHPVSAVPALPRAMPDATGNGGMFLVGDEREYRILSARDGMLFVEEEVGPDPLRPVSYTGHAGVPAIGEALVYVLAVQFSDLAGETPVGDIVADLSQTVGEYYNSVSRGLLELDFHLLAESWISVSQSKSYYGQDGSGVDNANQSIFELVREALIVADPFVDYTLLDTNGNGRLDAGEFHLMVVQSGEDQAQTGRSDDIWSHRWWIYGPPHGYDETYLDGVLVSEPEVSGNESSPGYSMVSVSDRVGVIAHELLHSFGAPDLYDVSGGSGVPVGPWSLMDIGLWFGTPSGSSPCRPGAYLEWDIDANPDNGTSGWLDPTPIYDGEHVISRLGGEEGTEAMIVETEVENEYFLLENRQKVGIDEGLHESGILIYHVDISEPINNIESRSPYRLWLEDPGIRSGKRGAAYSEDDGSDQTAFSSETDPSSSTNDGQSTEIAITSIGAEGDQMTFVLQGVGGSAPATRFGAGPVPVVGSWLTAFLPELGSGEGFLELYDPAGRRVAQKRLSSGSHQYSLHLPDGLGAGTFVLVYRSQAANYSTPLVILPPQSGN